jgi:hypothetical protein
MTKAGTGRAALALAPVAATLLALVILSPVVAKIRRRGLKDRPYQIQLISEPDKPKFESE